MASPLEGIRVIDLSRYIAGPLCGQLLGDFGAEVIKVESPKGEEGRSAFPLYEGFSLYFANFNRNKLGVSLNLRTPKGKELLRELVAHADVLLQNFRVGVMEEMGCSWQALAQINPRLVMLNISGFGKQSAYATWPAYDEIAQAMSGLMDLTGPKDGPPTLVGTAIVDHLTGIYSALGVLAALEQRQRTGQGQEVDISLVHSAVSVLWTHAPWYLVSGAEMTRNGNSHRLQAGINCYPTSDGYVYICAGRDHMWCKLAEVIGRRDLLANPDFATMEKRAERMPEVDALITAWTSQRTSAQAASVLAEAGVACGPVRKISEVASDPEIQEQGTIMRVASPAGGTVPVMGNPLHLAQAPVTVRRDPPTIGQDNARVYCGLLGHSEAEVEAWRKEGVI